MLTDPLGEASALYVILAVDQEALDFAAGDAPAELFLGELGANGGGRRGDSLVGHDLSTARGLTHAYLYTQL
jgi:hypothetical protein